jgi:predicted GH43/DUF377 family glycosyl hydrolase
MRPRSIIEIDPQRLLPGDSHFNSSIISYRGKLIMAYRIGFDFPRTGIAVLGDDYQPKENYKFEIPTLDPWNTYGKEDLRLFLHQGDLFGSYVGLSEQGANQILCKISPDFKVVEQCYLDYPERQRDEKNWQFFSYGKQLFCVYTIVPHVILRLFPNGKVEKAYETRSLIDWSLGFFRGGAPPILSSNRYYHFFHVTIPPRSGIPYKRYLGGCYAFHPEPPFHIDKMISGAILVPNRLERVRRRSSVVFPCGATKVDSGWLISYGYHDVWCRLAVFNESDLESRLLHVSRDSKTPTQQIQKMPETMGPKLYTRGICRRKRILEREKRIREREKRIAARTRAKELRSEVETQRTLNPSSKTTGKDGSEKPLNQT